MLHSQCLSRLFLLIISAVVPSNHRRLAESVVMGTKIAWISFSLSVGAFWGRGGGLSFISPSWRKLGIVGN
ncbi:hypothetical protein QN277_000683 [Acacia crassicarpa]|uniref:Secreted protein n=1 Tax=Acacia crassicarpa TaxID=499986 RepID=A0AAE1N5J9_9FABA|nr:hypothetical protein QN277_000683 [Acacia crassicarpa]